MAFSEGPFRGDNIANPFHTPTVSLFSKQTQAGPGSSKTKFTNLAASVGFTVRWPLC